MTILVSRAEFPGLHIIQLTYVISINSRKLVLTPNNCQLLKVLRFINECPYYDTNCSYLWTYTCLISPIFAVQRNPFAMHKESTIYVKQRRIYYLFSIIQTQILSTVCVDANYRFKSTYPTLLYITLSSTIR